MDKAGMEVHPSAGGLSAVSTSWAGIWAAMWRSSSGSSSSSSCGGHSAWSLCTLLLLVVLNACFLTVFLLAIPPQSASSSFFSSSSLFFTRPSPAQAQAPQRSNFHNASQEPLGTLQAPLQAPPQEPSQLHLDMRQSSVGGSPGMEECDDGKEGSGEEELREAAERVATEEGFVIVTDATKGMLHFVENWMYHTAKAGIAQHCLLVAHDSFSFQYIHNKWPGQAVHPPGALVPQDGASEGGAVMEYHSAGFLTLMKSKPTLILSFLRLNFSVLYSDLDVVFLSTPFPFLTGHHAPPPAQGPNGPPTSSSAAVGLGVPNSPSRCQSRARPGTRATPSPQPMYSVCFSADMPWESPLKHHTLLFSYVDPEFLRIQLNTGLFAFLAHQPAAVALAEEWNTSLLSAPGVYDQPALNSVVQGQLRDKLKRCRRPPCGSASLAVNHVGVLPFGMFCSGLEAQAAILAGRKPNCSVTLHFNYMWLKYLKLQLMARGGYWGSPIGALPGELRQCAVEQDENGVVGKIDKAALQRHVQPRVLNGSLIIALVRDLSESSINGSYCVLEDPSVLGQFWSSLQGAKREHNAVIFTGDQVTYEILNESHNGSSVLLYPHSKQPPVLTRFLLTKRPELLPLLLLHLHNLNISPCFCDLRTTSFPWPAPHLDHFDILVGAPGSTAGAPALELSLQGLKQMGLSLLCVRQSTSARLFLEMWGRKVRIGLRSIWAKKRREAEEAAGTGKMGQVSEQDESEERMGAERKENTEKSIGRQQGGGEKVKGRASSAQAEGRGGAEGEASTTNKTVRKGGSRSTSPRILKGELWLKARGATRLLLRSFRDAAMEVDVTVGWVSVAVAA